MGAQFATTHWSQVLAQEVDPSVGRFRSDPPQMYAPPIMFGIRSERPFPRVSSPDKTGLDMTGQLFTEPWAQAWSEVLNASAQYRAAASDWHGSICFKLRSRDPQRERSIFLDLQEGRCLAAREATDQDTREARFVLSARERVWKRLVEGRSDPLVVLMTGLIRFERGRLTDFASHGRAAQELMRAAQRIDHTGSG